MRTLEKEQKELLRDIRALKRVITLAKQNSIETYELSWMLSERELELADMEKDMRVKGSKNPGD